MTFFERIEQTTARNQARQFPSLEEKSESQTDKQAQALSNAVEPMAHLQKSVSEASEHEGESVTKSTPANNRNTNTSGCLAIRQYLPALLAAGWTRVAIFKRGKFRLPSDWGLVWLTIWKKDNLTVSIEPETGQVSFSFTNSTGRKITQSASLPALPREKRAQKTAKTANFR